MLVWGVLVGLAGNLKLDIRIKLSGIRHLALKRWKNPYRTYSQRDKVYASLRSLIQRVPYIRSELGRFDNTHRESALSTLNSPRLEIQPEQEVVGKENKEARLHDLSPTLRSLCFDCCIITKA